MFKNFITVPIVLEFQPKRTMFMNTYSFTVKELYKDWKNVTSPIDVGGSSNYAIVCGKPSNVTIIDVPFQGDFHISNHPYAICTPYGMHYYYTYERNLQSIYDLPNGISILNDNRLVFAGDKYNKLNEGGDIPKMPAELLNTLLEQQRSMPPINRKMYELYCMIPDVWFEDNGNYTKLVRALRNSTSGRRICIDTMRSVLVERYDWRPRNFEDPFNVEITYREERYGLTALVKEIKDLLGEQYDDWKKRWKDGYIKAKMMYKQGAHTKFADLQDIYRTGRLTSKNLIEMNPQWTTTTIKICKFCKNIHSKGCCNDYDRKQRASCLFVQNVTIRK